MNGHTPGPWRSDYGDARGRYIAADDGYVAIAHYWSRPDEEMQANARLISAAPELLAALDGLLSVYAEPDRALCCDGRECGCMGSSAYQEAEHYARAAIAKATMP